VLTVEVFLFALVPGIVIARRAHSSAKQAAGERSTGPMMRRRRRS